MIVVQVDLYSAITKEKNSLGTMVIDNIGGTNSRGDYRCRMYKKSELSRVGSAWLLHSQARPTRQAEVLNHACLAEPVHNLVAKALKAMGYE